MKDRLRAMFLDHLSIMRGKYLPDSKIGDDHTRFCRSTFGVHYDKDLLPAPGAMMMEGLPDMELRWKAEEVRDGWEPGTKVVLGDLFGEDGDPLALDGRAALRKAVADWEADGLSPMVGIELECFALQRDEDGKLVPYDAPGGVVYGTGPFTDPLRFTDAIWKKATKLGFNLEMMTGEYDSPQFEFTLTFDEAVKAVDDIVLFRQMAREIAFEHGIVLTFMPKPIADAGGSGMHVNFSFRDADGRNALGSGPQGGPDHMNDLSRKCVAGLMTHHKALAGFTAPSANSFQRLQPASLAGYWANWGGDHRNVTCRVSTEGGAKARIEHRMPDASSNPYTATAAVLQAARLGVQNGYDLGPIETGDGFEHSDAEVGVAGDLKSAMDDLAADAALANAVGKELAEHQIFMRNVEVEKTQDQDIDAMREFYAHFI
ncbi:glutamine synthetase family protein [Alisedimentitalea sp. MJ-SS2]|uniref:glutamine synthetase family protein n=1 Tax=Aliisedimentitalea sp. MJ-SS2 TaxID=3049795 RepID=UPI00290AC40A|nr:glutamine synthetase family protein [Alisedimentitalea sp. MJ-SS2]MDU8927998.1 glutamine synthetase family protein [Alisedimentitalea sp. MJ-SS2]